ncbi:MAG: hypothetical protein WCT04_21990 [Planctomycetota bacterium]
MLTALEKSDIEASRPLLEKFVLTTDYVEPYQKTFGMLVTEILERSKAESLRSVNVAARAVQIRVNFDTEMNAATKANNDLCAEKSAAIDTLRKKIVEVEAQITAVNNGIAQQDVIIARELNGLRDSERAASIGDAVGGRSGGILGLASSIAGAAGKGEFGNHARRKDAAEQQKAGLTISLGELKNQITALNAAIAKKTEETDVLKSILEKDKLTKVSLCNQQVSQMKAEEEGRGALSNIELKSRIVQFAVRMKEKVNYRPAIALAATYTKQVADDQDISKVAQDCINCQKMEAKAIEIARVVAKPVNISIAANRLYTARAELTKADESIALRITDELQLRCIKREMADCHSQLDKMLKAVQAKHDTIMEVAARDAVEGRSQFDSFIKEYIDYPEVEKDQLKLGDLRRQQVQKKFDNRIQAIREVIHNDPVEARKMITKLTNSEIDADEISVISSELVKVKREILEREVHLIRMDLDDAHSYLTKFNTTYDQIEKSPDHPETHLSKRLALSTENLIRAKSLQVGAVKRLEILMNEETDNVTKARLVSLLETQRSALGDIDTANGKIETDKKDQQRVLDDSAARIRLYIILGVSIFMVMGIAMLAGLWLILGRKKSPVAAATNAQG